VIDVHPLVPPIHATVITVSDRCARGEAIDTSGPAVVALLEEKLGAQVDPVVIVPDSTAEITAALLHGIGQGMDLILTTGGTGCASRDETPEATEAVIERPVPGISELIRSAGAARTPLAWLSRGVSGIAGHSLLVNLPGSERGASESLEAIVHLLPHAIRLLRGDTRHPSSDRDR
jgi:molybdenum cofactor synthesis domain-containing protein